MTDFESLPEDKEQEEKATQALRNYWAERLAEFERVIYPVFYAKGYSKNTALLACMMDELDDSLTVAAAIVKRGESDES